MANLSVIFKMVDEVSNGLASIANGGADAADRMEAIGEAASSSFDTVMGSATQTAHSIDDLTASSETLEGALNNAATSTDGWTDALGNYDKSAMEAVYTTEELVEMGMKSAEVLEEQERMFELCEQSATSLNRAMEASTDIHSELEKAIESASDVMSEIADNEKVSAETKEELTRASETASDAMRELEAAQIAAQQSMENYDAVIMSGTEDLETLEAAAEKACHASEALAEANEKASNASEELASTTEKAGEELENAGDSGEDAITSLQDALAAAGIAVSIKEISEATYELADNFSEAESVIVKATGATGKALDSLNDSMLKVYSNIDDDNMENTAGAIGELNTRLGLTGDTLTEVGELFMMYADNTNSSVVPAVQSVTKVMKNWDVEVEETEELLDKLTYAAQASGASVDSLSDGVVTNKAVFQQLGYSLDESIGFLSMMEYEGLNTTSVMTGLRTAIGNITADGQDAATGLNEIITEIANMADESEATALAVDTFGSRAGTELAYAIRNGKFEIEQWTSAIENSEGTLAKTDDAADTLADKWTQASNSMTTAFTSVLEPSINKISLVLADVTSGAADFLNKNPAVVAGLTGLALGIGVIAVATQAKTVATVAATIATAAWDAVLALNPVVLIAAGVVALVSAIGLLITAMGDSETEYDTWTASTKRQYDELENLNDEYERACEQYGETSEEASRLKYQVDDLSESFESSKQTVEEFTAECEALCEANDKLVSSYQEGTTEINNNEIGTLALIQKLEDLATATNSSTTAETEMKAIVDKLNEELPDLALSYEDVTASAKGTVAILKEAAEAQAEQERFQKSRESYVALLEEQAKLEEQIAKAEENVRLEQEKITDDWLCVDGSLWTSWTTDIDEYEKALSQLETSYAENKSTLADIERQWEDVAAAEAEAAEATIDYETAVSTSLESVQEEIDELVAKYDEAYESARSSIDGQIGLFDTMKTECEISVTDMVTAMQSQIEYLATYTENLQKAAQYGIDDGLVASLSDGSSESAGYVNAIIEEIEKLGGTTEGMSEDAAAFVSQFNTSFEGVETAKDGFATTVAEMETDFTSSMDAIEEKLNASIDNMNMEEDAAAAAKATMDGYVQSIKDQQSAAVSAATAVAKATAAALNTSASISISTRGISGTVPGFATGTTDAPDMYIAGEEGPELIVGAAGSTVFPTDETEKILGSLGTVPLETSVPEGLGGDSRSNYTNTEEKKFTIAVEGSGKIGIGSGMSKDSVLDLLYDSLKPILMNILKEEILEEGDMAYEY